MGATYNALYKIIVMRIIFWFVYPVQEKPLENTQKER